MSTDAARGQFAQSPTEIPPGGWRDILMRVKDEIGRDHVSVVSAGVAFFGLLAIFPAVTALISIAGLLLDPEDVADQIESAAGVLPADAASILQEQVVQVTGGSETGFGLAALLGILIAVYGATKGMKTLIEGMNIAYDETEKRGLVAQNLTAFVLTLLLILGVIAGFVVLAVLPAAVAFLGLPDEMARLIAWAKWPILAVLAMLGLAIVYRYGPSRANPKWRWVSPGAVVATLIWLAGTVAFSLYVRNFGSYNETYGALGGVIILLTWLWLSAFIILLGAELNSEMEHQTRKDSTTGTPQPEGERGAVKADHRPRQFRDAGGARAASTGPADDAGDPPRRAKQTGRPPEAPRRDPGGDAEADGGSAVVLLLGLLAAVALFRVAQDDER